MVSLATLYFPAGVLLGLGSAAPVGPINLLVIQRTLNDSRSPALLLGLGAALGDVLFATIAGFGLGAIGSLVRDHDSLIRIIGGLFMLGFAVLVWRAAPHLEDEPIGGNGARLVLLGLSMAATNPASLLFFIGSFGAIGFTAIGHDSGIDLFHAAMLVAGVFIGSMTWWVVISGIARRLRGRVSDDHLRLLNHGTAAALALFGLVATITGASMA